MAVKPQFQPSESFLSLTVLIEVADISVVLVVALLGLFLIFLSERADTKQSQIVRLSIFSYHLIPKQRKTFWKDQELNPGPLAPQGALHR